MKRGAADYIPKPFTPAQISLAVNKVFEVRALEQKVAALRDLGRQRPDIDFSSTSPIMLKAVNLARHASAAEATMLLRGESGTGKTVLARAIHSWSNRAAKPFSVISSSSFLLNFLKASSLATPRGPSRAPAATIPAASPRAEGGTLLLDEISDLPLSLQPKLLRFVQEREYERVGESFTRRADVRLIAASNTDLEEAVRKGRFREDLFYRLNVIPIEIPALRERGGDITALAEGLLAFHGRNNHRAFLGFKDDALSAMMGYRWPGNVRELSNTIERAAILCPGDWIGSECLPASLIPGGAAVKIGDAVSLETIEEQHVRQVLAKATTLQEAAAILGIDQATLWRRRKRYGL